MKLNTYVNFAGKCAEAFRFYEEHLGARVGMMMTHGQSPDQSHVKPEWKDAVLHARLSIGGTELMGADIPNAQPMRSAYLSLSVQSDADATGSRIASVAVLIGAIAAVIAAATIWLLLTDPVTVATAVETGEISPLVRQLAEVIYNTIAGLLNYL